MFVAFSVIHFQIFSFCGLFFFGGGCFLFLLFFFLFLLLLLLLFLGKGKEKSQSLISVLFKL